MVAFNQTPETWEPICWRASGFSSKMLQPSACCCRLKPLWRCSNTWRYSVRRQTGAFLTPEAVWKHTWGVFQLYLQLYYNDVRRAASTKADIVVIEGQIVTNICFVSFNGVFALMFANVLLSTTPTHTHSPVIMNCMEWDDRLLLQLDLALMIFCVFFLYFPIPLNGHIVVIRKREQQAATP